MLQQRLKKMFQPALGCAQHPKAGRNTQQVPLLFWMSVDSNFMLSATQVNMFKLDKNLTCIEYFSFL